MFAMKLADFDRVPLGFLPTPVEAMERLGAELGIGLRIKRDDYTGFGVGGNKIRKMEYLMADARSQGANVLITTGGHQSNHARTVAAAAAKFGMRSVLVLRGDRPDTYQGNLLLDRIFGAELEFLDPDAYFDLIEERMEAHAEAARQNGEVPFIIPLGGANATGALGYVRAVEEMRAQYEASGARAPDVVLLPCGSGGTFAGLLVGCKMFWPQTRVIGISVSRDAAWFQGVVSKIANECANLLGETFIWQPEDVSVADRFVGTRYGVPSDDGNSAILRVGRTEGLLLDPVYTGKAMAGLFGLVEDGTIAQGSEVTFIHCGGSPALYPFAETLVDA
ncbi:1-aminocyclopropane-1-carboxylate deaminase/D-cysteine desulfhydrase [Acetobacter fallax]|nr:D-cysteine desulfhydrase family protein [Acetobacter fallax]